MSLIRKFTLFGLMREKSSIGKGSQAFRSRSESAFHAKSNGGRLDNWNLQLMCIGIHEAA